MISELFACLVTFSTAQHAHAVSIATSPNARFFSNYAMENCQHLVFGMVLAAMGCHGVLAVVRLTGDSEDTDKPIVGFKKWLSAQLSAAVVTDSTGVIVATNELLASIIPRHELSPESSVNLLDVLTSESGVDALPQTAHEVLAGTIPPAASTFSMSYGDLPSLEVSVSPQLDHLGEVAYWLWVLRDASDHHRLQQHQEHTQKMQAITRLAGGMAHEFNNLLTAVLGNLELLRADPERPVRDIVSYAEAAEVAALRASQLIHELRMFASRDAPVRVSQSVAPVVRKVRRILAGVASERIRVSHSFDSQEEPFAEINAEHLEDALLKLGLNAIEAVGSNRGVVQIEVHVLRPVDEPPAVKICIVDSGDELSESAADKAFEPFSATGDPQESARLGMAIAYGLVEEMDGTVSISRSSRVGNQVTVSLPLCAPPDSGLHDADSGIGQCPRTLSVAIVDSEPSIRKVAKGMLGLLGHATHSFDTGASFLNAVEDEKRFDLVILDNAMPGLSGRRTYQQLRRVDADVPVVICSGRSVDLQTYCPEVERAPDAFLSKPFSIADLSAIVAPYS